MNHTWREQSLQIIADRYASIKKMQPYLSNADILRMVSLHYYPFGERSMHPYKAWLLAMNEMKRKLGVITASDAKTELPLFDIK